MDYVLHEVSYANIVMYGSVLPTYTGKDGGKNGEVIMADDPANKDKVHKFLQDID